MQKREKEARKRLNNQLKTQQAMEANQLRKQETDKRKAQLRQQEQAELQRKIQNTQSAKQARDNGIAGRKKAKEEAEKKDGGCPCQQDKKDAPKKAHIKANKSNKYKKASKAIKKKKTDKKPPQNGN